MIYNDYRFKLPEDMTIRVITDTDAKNQADDQFAIVHTLLSPRFDNRALIAAHFAPKYSAETMEESYRELHNILEVMRFDKDNVYRGAAVPMKDQKTPVPSPGAEKIVEEAMRNDDRPLFVTALGPLTDIASAYLMEPRIARKMTVIWIGGGVYPNGGWEYNLQNDINAANTVFRSDIPLWQIPKNVYQQILVSLVELEQRMAKAGRLGQYLMDQVMDFIDRKAYLSWEVGRSETWCLGDSPVVGLMLLAQQHSPDIDGRDFEWMPAPEFSQDMAYIHTGNNRPIRVYRKIDQRFILEDMYAKLEKFATHDND